jgi:hypothetical protein
MARKTNYSFQKSEREKVRQKKKKEKLDRKQEAKDRKAALQSEGVDPDIADIEPGPQTPKDSED